MLNQSCRHKTSAGNHIIISKLNCLKRKNLWTITTTEQADTTKSYSPHTARLIDQLGFNGSFSTKSYTVP